MNHHADAFASPLSRRTFLAAGAQAVASMGAAITVAAETQTRTCPPVHVFSKHLQWLDYQGMAETAAEIGFDGVDLTVRPKGHVLPERVEDELPRAVEAVKKVGLSVDMMVSSVNDPRHERTEAILKTAADQGIRYYRMGYHRYDRDRDILQQLDAFKPLFLDLSAINHQYGLAATYQNHAGERYVGAGLWDLHALIKDLDRRWMGSQFDIRHALAEGGTTWTVTLRLLARFINTLAIKDFVWARQGNSWRTQNVPLGEGMVDFSKYVTLLRKLNVHVPISLHLEYPIAGAEHGDRTLSGDKRIVLDAMRRDLNYVRSVFS